jgi:predicted RNA-binding Zn-ribbon protein involved in translation (DUF1610 family)
VLGLASQRGEKQGEEQAMHARAGQRVRSVPWLVLYQPLRLHDVLSNALFIAHYTITPLSSSHVYALLTLPDPVMAFSCPICSTIIMKWTVCRQFRIATVCRRAAPGFFFLDADDLQPTMHYKSLTVSCAQRLQVS